MKNRILLFAVVLLMLPTFAWSLEITEGVIAAGVEQRQPVDVSDHFSASLGRVYCFTKVRGGSSEDGITHVWLMQGREMARVELSVRSDNWRTWSSKRILPEWRGEWIVKVLDRSGMELASIPFTLE